jgi:hypothetical protein
VIGRSAKNLPRRDSGSIPGDHGRARGAESPIANRYARVGQQDAAREAVRKAIDTYQGLIDRDTTSAFCVLYRWATLRCQMRLDDNKGALRTVDEMVRKDMGQAINGASTSARRADRATSTIRICGPGATCSCSWPIIRRAPWWAT